MARSLRSNRLKRNKQILRKTVYQPAEDARLERLSSKLRGETNGENASLIANSIGVNQTVFKPLYTESSMAIDMEISNDNAKSSTKRKNTRSKDQNLIETGDDMMKLDNETTTKNPKNKRSNMSRSKIAKLKHKKKKKHHSKF